MSFFEFPHTRNYDSDLGWLIKTMHEVLDNVEAQNAAIELYKTWVTNRAQEIEDWTTEHVEAVEQLAKDLQNFVNTYFDNLDVQQEINNKINDMAQDGSLLALLQSPVTTIVGDWLTAHLTPTSPPVDNTLTIAGAAADAKVTGDKITELKNDIFNSNNGLESFGLYGTFYIGGLNEDGSLKPAQQYRVSCPDRLTFDRNITVHISNGYKWGYVQYIDDETLWHGWYTSDISIPAQTVFSIQIGKTPEASSAANIEEYENALTFDTELLTDVAYVNNGLSNIKDAIALVDDFGQSWVFFALGAPKIDKSGNVYTFSHYQNSGRYVPIALSADSPYTGVNNPFNLPDDAYTINLKPNTIYQLQVYHSGDLSEYGEIYIRQKNADTSLARVNLYEFTITANTIYVTFTTPDSTDPYVIYYLKDNKEVAGTYRIILRQVENDVTTINKNIEIAKNNSLIAQNPFRYKKYMSHTINNIGNVIPNQSLFDIEYSKRLGFDVIEANIHATSDGQYVVIHGSSGKFGNQVEHTDGTTNISETAISSVTLDWIKQNVRYKTSDPRFKTSIPTLQEFCYACKNNDIQIFVTASSPAVIEIVEKIMGADNYIAYNGNRETSPTAPIAVYSTLTDPDQILELCNSYGRPFIFTMSATTSLSDSQLTEIVNKLHTNGYLIGFAAVYVTAEEAERLMRLGFDMASSATQINDFGTGNICNLDSNDSFSEFTTTGTISTDGIHLEAGETITPNTTIPTVFLSGGILSILFNGSITVSYQRESDVVTASIDSDGSHYTHLPRCYVNTAPSFTITANNSTTVIDICYNASKM